MKFYPSPILLAVACTSLSALLGLSSCQTASDETKTTDTPTEGTAVSPYALEFSAEQQAEREAKWSEEGARRIELSNGYSVFTQTFGENPDVCILTLHGGPAATHEYLLSLAYDLPTDHGYEVVMYDQLSFLQHPVQIFVFF